jgi:hypothetical protein
MLRYLVRVQVLQRVAAINHIECAYIVQVEHVAHEMRLYVRVDIYPNFIEMREPVGNRLAPASEM